MSERIYQIGLFLPPTTGYFADVLSGAQEYARTAGSWTVEVCPNLTSAEISVRSWRPDGILLNAIGEDWKPLITRLGIPTVEVGGEALPGVPQVRTDNAAIGRLAANYLMERGFRHFAYIGYAYLRWATDRGQAYTATLKQRGLTCQSLHGDWGDIHSSQITGKLSDWVRQLTKPVAVFACHDRAAMLVGHVCHHLGVHVPEQVAILGVDNNLFECSFTNPPISSIMGSSRRIGYQAAALLHAMMNGKPEPTAPIEVEPAGVETRASTDIFAAADADVAAALRFIEKNAGEPIMVDDVAHAVFATRRMLERKFMAALQQSPRERILHAHIEQAKRLLIHSDLPMLDVALRSGFPSGSKFSAVFKRETGTNPRQFRRLYGAIPARSVGIPFE